MNNKFSDFLRKSLAEIIVIFVGISASFWFDEWREGRKDREMERKILINLKENLAQDTLILTAYVKGGNDFTRSINQLISLKKTKDISDSLNFYIDMAASYIVFNSNQTVYEEIKQTGHASLIQDDTLKRAILGHYTVIVPQSKEWCAADKSHTESLLIPLMTKYFPIVVDSMNLVSNEKKIAALKNQELSNLLSSSKIYKKTTLETLDYTNEFAKKLIKRIDKRLQKMSN